MENMIMADKAAQAILLVFFGICAVQDIRHKRISLILLCCGSGAGIIFRAVSGRFTVTGILCDLLPGAVMFLISFLSRQALGYADSFMITAAGIFLGWQKCVSILIISLLCCMAVSACLLCMKKMKWRDELAFAPFLLAGSVLWEVMNC